MYRRNICKFTSATYSENLSVSCFVLETDKQVMQTKHILSSYRMLLAMEGDGQILIDTEAVPFNNGTLLFCFHGEQIQVSCNEVCKYMYIDFDGLRAEELLKRFNIHKHNRHFAGLDGLIPLWEESLSRASNDTIDLVAESMVIYTFSRLNVTASHCDNTLNRILQITEEQFNNFDLSITAIANELQYNPKYLSHLFKQKTNKSYSEYLRCIRLKYAVSLLDSGIDSVKNVALLSGFSDPLYFSTVFKRTMGLSPKEYIAKNNRDL